MPLKKQYSFSKTLPAVADVIVKVKLLQSLNPKEELIYLMFVKGISKVEAHKIVDARSGF